MKHDSFPGQPCSVARSLEVIGEWWTLLIVRESFFGTTRFSDFEHRLGISKNVLSERLSALVSSGVMKRVAVRGRGNPVEYRLTDAGRDLLPVMVALVQWGDKWINKRREPVCLLDHTSAKAISALTVTSQDGRPLSCDQIIIVPGPGADAAVKKRFGSSRTSRS